MSGLARISVCDSIDGATVEDAFARTTGNAARRAEGPGRQTRHRTLSSAREAEDPTAIRDEGTMRKALCTFSWHPCPRRAQKQCLCGDWDGSRDRERVLMLMARGPGF